MKLVQTHVVAKFGKPFTELHFTPNLYLLKIFNFIS